MSDPAALFLVLDAVPFDIAYEAWRRGWMEGFDAPRPMISTFPSLTTCAVPALVEPVFHRRPPGYETRWYHPPSGEIRGGLVDPPTEATVAPFQGRPVGRVAHVAVYSLPSEVSYHQARWITERFAREGGPWLGWVTATDGVGHFEGPEAMLLAVGNALRAVQRARKAYEREHGTLPAVVLASDHGMAFSESLRHLDALQVEWALRRAGVPTGAPDGAVLVPLGDVGAAAIHGPRTLARPVAEVVAGLEGVDLVVWREDDHGARIQTADRGSARLHWGNGRTRYAPVDGDPLGLADIASQLGDATDRAWLEATAGHAYPAAPPRIRHGLTELVTWPAPVLVSMAEGWTYGAPLTHVAARLRGGQIGTHGALNRAQSTGFAASTDPSGWPAGPLVPGDVFRPWSDRLRPLGAVSR